MKACLCLLVVVLGSSAALAQHGGKAEPKRIEIARGHTMATVTGTLSNDQEMDLVFAAKAGQTVRLSVTSVPKGRLFDFQIKGDGSDVPADLDRYTSFTFKAPATGDYLVFVRKRPTQKVRRAKFFLRLVIE